MHKVPENGTFRNKYLLTIKLKTMLETTDGTRIPYEHIVRLKPNPKGGWWLYDRLGALHECDEGGYQKLDSYFYYKLKNNK